MKTGNIKYSKEDAPFRDSDSINMKAISIIGNEMNRVVSKNARLQIFSFKR